MKEYVIIDKSHLVASADKMRELTGKTGKFSLSELSWNTLDTINQSGGASLGKLLYKFGVLADIHICDGEDSQAEYFDRALTLFESLGASLVCGAGDIADNGLVSELTRFKAICDAHPNLEIHTCRGNHDRPLLDIEWSNCLMRDNNYDIIYNNDVFVFWSITHGDSSTDSYEANFNWLTQRLSRYKGSRCFVFMHYPPSGYSGLADGQYYGFSSSATIDDELITLLNQIKNITLFTGHTHYRFAAQEYYNSMNAFRFNSSDVQLIHVPSSAYCRNENFGSSGESEGWLVDVYAKGFVLNGYNLLTGEKIEGTEYFFVTDNVETARNAIVLDDVDMVLTASQTGTVNVTLAASGAETINVSCSNDAVTVSPTTLTFTESNWNVPQTVTITAPSVINEATGCMVNFESEGLAKRVVSVMLSTNIEAPTIAADDTWYKSATSRSTFTKIKLVNSSNSVPTTYTETWDASEDNDGSVNAYIDGTTLYIAGNGASTIKTGTHAEYMFSDSAETDFFSNVTAIEGIELLDTSNAIFMNGMFYNCSALTELDVSHFNTENVRGVWAMFYNCASLTELNVENWAISNLYDLDTTFSKCSSLTSLDLSGWDISTARSASDTFYHCDALTELNLSGWNTTSITDMGSMFSYCMSLTNLTFDDNWVTTQVTDMHSMFKHCESLTELDLSKFNTSNVTDMHEMFSDCVDLTSLNVSSFDTSKVTDMSGMFDHCDSLTTLDISNFDTRAITSSAEDAGLYSFARKSGITNLTVGANFVQDYNMWTAGSYGMFYTSNTTPLTITGANSVLKTYDFATDHRTVTFTN